MQWCFETHYLIERADGTQSEFRYCFSQREAVESVLWRDDVRRTPDKYDRGGLVVVWWFANRPGKAPELRWGR